MAAGRVAWTTDGFHRRDEPQPVEHFAQVVIGLARTLPRQSPMRRSHCPFLIGHIGRQGGLIGAHPPDVHQACSIDYTFWSRSSLQQLWQSAALPK